MSGQRSDVGFIELELEDRPGEGSASFWRPDGAGRAAFHDLSPDGTATEPGCCPTASRNSSPGIVARYVSRLR